MSSFSDVMQKRIRFYCSIHDYIICEYTCINTVNCIYGNIKYISVQHGWLLKKCSTHWQKMNVRES